MKDQELLSDYRHIVCHLTDISNSADNLSKRNFVVNEIYRLTLVASGYDQISNLKRAIATKLK